MTDPALPFELGQVRLGNHAFEGQNNCYVLGLEDGAVTTLVDTGVSTADTRADLEVGLAEYDVEFADVEQILLTHWHADHTGLAGAIQHESGATVRVHEADAPVVRGDVLGAGPTTDRMQSRFERWGMPDDARRELVDVLTASLEGYGDPPEVEPFEADARFDLGSVELEAVHLPGHTAGLSGFAFDGRDGEELFSGDALLPYYTPNVGGADTRLDRPLANYLDTLAGIVERGYTRAWPGHRGAIIDPPGRAADIAVHHRERTERVLDYLERDGPADAWTVSAHLFGGLSSIHVLHGPGEAAAHLDHLEEAGLVEAEIRPGGRREYVFRTRAGVDDLFPDVEAAAHAPEAISGGGD